MKCEDCGREMRWIRMRGGAKRTETLYTRHRDGKQVCGTCLDGRDMSLGARLRELDAKQKKASDEP